jgi:hypothetical protein
MTDQPTREGWEEYRRMVLNELKRLGETVVAVNEKLDRFHSEEIAQIKVDIALLKLKAGLWGATASVIVTIGAVLIKLLIGKG